MITSGDQALTCSSQVLKACAVGSLATAAVRREQLLLDDPREDEVLALLRELGDVVHQGSALDQDSDRQRLRHRGELQRDRSAEVPGYRRRGTPRGRMAAVRRPAAGPRR